MLARAAPGWQTAGMGPAIMAVVLLVLIPFLAFVAGGVAAGGLGFLLKKKAEEGLEGTEVLAMGELG